MEALLLHYKLDGQVHLQVRNKLHHKVKSCVSGTETSGTVMATVQAACCAATTGKWQDSISAGPALFDAQAPLWTHGVQGAPPQLHISTAQLASEPVGC